MDLFNKAVTLCKSSSVKKRILAINILSQLGSGQRPFVRQSSKLYFELLSKENNKKVIEALLYAVGHLNSKLTSDQAFRLCQFFDSGSEDVRVALTFALGEIQQKKVYEVLVTLSNDRSKTVRDWATFRLAQGKGDSKMIRDALFTRVFDASYDVKMEAIVGLAKRKDNRCRSLIELELAKGNFGDLVFEAISNLRDRTYLAPLSAVLSEARTDHSVDKNWLLKLTTLVNELKSKSP